LSIEQCSACHEYVDFSQNNCQRCGALLPRGVAARQERSRSLPQEHRAARDAYQRYKTELTHLPYWMRDIFQTVDNAYENRKLHMTVQFIGGAAGFLVAYGLAAYLPFGLLAGLDPFFTAGRLAYLHKAAHFIAGLAGFGLAGHFVFKGFYTTLEAMAEVFGGIKEDRIARGKHDERASRLKRD
jgi:hypothetical protein